MNRFQLVQVVVITIALWIGYETFTYIFLFLEELTVGFDRGMNEGVVIYGVNSLVFSALFFVLIRKTSNIAIWVLSKTDLDPDVQLNLSASSFLLGIIVFLGLKTVIESGADLLANAAIKFSTVRFKTEHFFSGAILKDSLQFIAGILLIGYAKPLSQYFEKQTDDYDPHQILGDAEAGNEPL